MKFAEMKYERPNYEELAPKLNALMDQLEKAGIVGAAMGSKPREVLIQDENSLNNLLISLRNK